MKFLPRRAAMLAVAMLIPALAAAQEPAPQGPPPGGPQGRGRMAGPGGGRMGGAPMMGPRMNRPQLTEQQREQVRALDEQQRQALEATHRELGDLHRQLNEQLSAAALDTAAINALRSSIVQKQTALAQARLDRLAKLSAILTAEQRQALRGRGIAQMFGPGGRGAAMAGPRGPMGGRGMAQRHGRRGRAGGGPSLRAEIRRLEAQIHALRRRIR